MINLIILLGGVFLIATYITFFTEPKSSHKKVANQG